MSSFQTVKLYLQLYTGGVYVQIYMEIFIKQIGFLKSVCRQFMLLIQQINDLHSMYSRSLVHYLQICGLHYGYKCIKS